MAEKICWRETNSFCIFMCLCSYLTFFLFHITTHNLRFVLLYLKNITTKKCFVYYTNSTRFGYRGIRRGMSEYGYYFSEILYMNDCRKYIYSYTLRIILWYILVLFWGCFDLMIYCSSVWMYVLLYSLNYYREIWMFFLAFDCKHSDKFTALFY